MAKKKEIQPQASFLEKSDQFLGKNEKILFWILFGICLLICFLLYDPRVSIAGDDSVYILRALDFGTKFTFPSFQGPLYPLLLSPVTYCFGISLFPLKLFSIVAMMAFFYFTYLAFRRRIPHSLLFTVLLLVAINSQVLYYASQTFSEALYLFIQSLLLLVFFRFFTSSDTDDFKITRYVKRHAWLALTILSLALTRSVGFSAVVAVAGYFICYRQWKNAGVSLLCFALFFLAYQGVKWLLWKDGGIQFSGQGASLMSKNYYQPEAGSEDIAGLVNRFWINSQLYLSEIFIAIAGLKEFRKDANIEGNLTSMNAISTLIIYAIAICGLLFSFKRNKNLFFSGLLCGVFLLVSFISLQTTWFQSRLIIPAYPLMLLLCFSALYDCLSGKKLRRWQFLFILPVIILTLTGMKDTFNQVVEVRKIKNEYSGLTPDWKHFAETSAWIGENLTKNEIAASRKSSISTIYAKGKEFYGIYSIPSEDVEPFMVDWNQQPEQYIVVNIGAVNTTQYTQIKTLFYVWVIHNTGQFVFLKNEEPTRNLLVALQIPVIDPADFLQGMKQSNDKPVIYSADTLLKQLREAKVTHVLSANLRLNPDVKGNQTINTVERYMFIIGERYPGIFTRIHQNGNDKDEPAFVYKINWEAAGN